MERTRKTLQELMIIDGFLFGAVMMDPENYVIFICDYDPFGREKYRYTIGS